MNFWIKTVVLHKGGWLFLGFLLMLGSVEPLRAETRIAKNAEIQASAQEVQELIASFNVMEQAIKTKALGTLMGFYSDRYAHLGADKAEMKKIWTKLFQDYSELISGHTFTKIYIQRGKHLAAVVCSGSMFGINARTGEKEPIDNWVEEIHYLTYEDGKWKILGHEVESPEEGRFGMAFHPLF